MRTVHFLAIIALLGPLPALQAQWRLETTHSLPSPAPAVTHEEITVQAVPQGRRVELHLLRWENRRPALRVLDLPAGTSVAEGIQSAGGIAGVNGGYFTPDQTPLGLVISNGKKFHPWESSKILTGVMVVTPRGASLLRNAEFLALSSPQSVKEALQAGPFLVDRGKAVSGLNAKRAAERTLLLADDRGVTAFLISAPVTLAELAQILATPDLIPGLKIRRALNLDGGSSTALWVAGNPPFTHPEWKRVRNAVALLPKQ